MTPAGILAAAACTFVLAATSAHAAPDLRQPHRAGNLDVYPDDERPDLFYVAPGDIVRAADADGKPDLHFLLTRYTGTAGSGDRGLVVYRSLLSFRVNMQAATESELRAAKSGLEASGGRAVELRPLPIRRLEAVVVYTPIGSASGEATSLPDGHFEAGGSDRAADGYWIDRIYTLGLDPGTAELFERAIRSGQVVVSLGYAFYADGIGPDTPIEMSSRATPSLTASQPLLAALRRAARDPIDRPVAAPGAQAPASGEPPAIGTYLIRAGATSITVDSLRWPDLVRRIDINDSAPPGYAALDIYCYDFNNALRPELYEKHVEIEAEGVGRSRVRLSTVFSRSEPDLYARSVRFPVAVRLDRPYRFRTIEIANDGGETTSEWQPGGRWASLLDVTSRLEPARGASAGGR